MRVIIASTVVPFVDGGGRLIVTWTAEELRARGHEVEVLWLPFPTGPREVLAAAVGLRATPVAGAGDRLITIRWPAHLLRHENKTTWFIHHYRELFDLWDTPLRPVADDAEGWSYREIVRGLDATGLSECTEVFCNSAVVRDRLRRFNGVEATPLLPPLGGDLSRFRADEYGDYIFYPSRVVPLKRQLLAIEAMRHTRSGVRLVIAGRPDVPAFGEQVRRYVTQMDLSDRVDLRLGWLPEDEKATLLSGALAVCYLPTDEDSYGYPSLEASHCARAVVTTTDSGGVLEFVRDRVEGRVVDPTPRALAAAFDELYEDRVAAARLGSAAFARRSDLHIEWDHTIARLLGEDE